VHYCFQCFCVQSTKLVVPHCSTVTLLHSPLSWYSISAIEELSSVIHLHMRQACRKKRDLMMSPLCVIVSLIVDSGRVNSFDICEINVVHWLGFCAAICAVVFFCKHLCVSPPLIKLAKWELCHVVVSVLDVFTQLC